MISAYQPSRAFRSEQAHDDNPAQPDMNVGTAYRRFASLYKLAHCYAQPAEIGVDLQADLHAGQRQDRAFLVA